MRRLILPGDLRGLTEWRADKATSRYLVRVLRLTAGDRFPARDEAGTRYHCTVIDADPGACLLGLEVQVEAGPGEAIPTGTGAIGTGPVAQGRIGRPRICLVQALPKGRKLDLIVRQAAESEVARVQPVQTSRSIARISGEGASPERLRRVIREALQQSGSDIATELADPVDFNRLFDELAAAGFGADRALRLFCHETPLAPGSLHGYCAQGPDAVVVAIGPEGGFSPGECDRFRAEGFRPLHFAGAVLRAETASLYAIAAIRTVLTEYDSWKAQP